VNYVLSYNDLIFIPFCLLVLLLLFRTRVNAYKDKSFRKILWAVFWFKMICSILFALVTEFYFKGGDTATYYQAIKDFRVAINNDFDNLWEAVFRSRMSKESPLYTFFFYDYYTGDTTVNYMFNVSNFFVPRLGLIPSYLFGNSYICISMCFSFFALGGAIRLFKTFLHFFPKFRKEIAIATLFLPDVAYWSSGFLKDSICFGCLGFILYGLLNIFIRKRKIVVSILIVFIAGYLLFSIKVYILLTLIIGVLIWFFAEINSVVKDKLLRRLFAFMTFSVAAVVGVFLLNYFTSQAGLEEYQLEKLAEQTAVQRNNFDMIATGFQKGSSFSYTTSNPVLLFLYGMMATFFRPFLWEISSPIVLFSAIEALIFTLLTVNILFKVGVKTFFNGILKDPRLLMCFVFAMVFSSVVGSSSTNFGALSRYKIPCLPFYMLMLLISYRKLNLAYPKWFSSLINRIFKFS
jgi:hypothetical protein